MSNNTIRVLFYLCDFNESIEVWLPFRMNKGDFINLDQFSDVTLIDSLSEKARDEIEQGIIYECTMVSLCNDGKGIYQQCYLESE